MRNPLRIPGIAWVGVLVAALLVAAGVGIAARSPTSDAAAAHAVTRRAERTAAAAETVFVHDTVRATAGRATYTAARDTALAQLTDTVTVQAAFAAADNALLLDSTAIASAGRTLEAYRILVGAQQGELAIARRQRERHVAVHALGGIDLTDHVPIAELSATMRVTDRWAVVARASQRFTIGESPRRLLLLRYTF